VIIFRGSLGGAEAILELVYIVHFPVLPEMVAPAVRQNTEYPAIEQRGIAQLPGIFQCLDQRFLNQIISKRGIVTPGKGYTI
jgi:hypothetical protein